MTLRQAASKRGIFFGAATNVAGVQGQSEPQYRPVEQAQFSLTTAVRRGSTQLPLPLVHRLTWFAPRR